jgi:hypothetical protein
MKYYVDGEYPDNVDGKDGYSWQDQLGLLLTWIEEYIDMNRRFRDKCKAG